MIPFINFYLSLLLTLWDRETITIFAYGIIYLFGILAYSKAFLRKPISVILLLGFTVTFIGSFALNQANVKYSFNYSVPNLYNFANSNFMFFWGVCFPIFLLFLLPVNVDKLLKVLKNYSVLNIILFIGVTFLYNFIYNYKLEYMTTAYSAVLSIFICYDYGVKYKKKQYMLLTFVALCLVAVGGSRGALLTVGIFIALYTLLNSKLTPKKLMYIFLFFVSLIYVLNNFNELIAGLAYALSDLGYNSRILMNFFGSEGGITHYGDRAILQQPLIDSINIFGYGLYGDRVILDGSYAHNWILELVINFGLLFGIIIVISILFFSFRAFNLAIKSNNNQLIFLMICLASYLLGKFFFSASYIQSAEFWFCMGFLYYVNFKNIPIRKSIPQKKFTY